MLIATPNHVATGIPGRVEDIWQVIDGRALERWFLKTICGAIVSGSIENVQVVPEPWIDVLFGTIAWPEEWTIGDLVA
jgi:hypothetical protein